MGDEQRLSFGTVAGLYDEARPSYPNALIDDVIDLAPIGAPLSALEVGAGTGKATEQFAARGVAVLAIDPSVEMAEIAQQRLNGFADVTIECADFEQCEPGSASFGLIYAAQAWHWVDADTAYERAWSLLQPGGLLAAFWNRPKWETSPVRAQLIEAYARALPERPPDDTMHPGAPSRADRWEEWSRGVESTPGLGWAKVRSYPWAHEYTTDEYLALLRTHSPNIVLPDARREALLYEVGRVIDRDARGVLALDYVTWLYLARAQ